MGSSKRMLHEVNDTSTEATTRPSKKRKSEKKDADAAADAQLVEAEPPTLVRDSSNEDDEQKQKTEAKAAKKEERRRLRKERKGLKKELRRREKKEQQERQDREEKIEAKKEKAAGDEYDSTYVQAKSLSATPQSDVDAFLAKEMINVTDPDVAGQSANLRPILDFAYLPHTALLAEHPFSAYDAPTPIQAASWPYTLSGRDVIGVAETGSGKTMAFALPCIESVVRACAAAKDKKPKGRKIIRAVVVSPTRELAMQTHTQMVSLAGHVGLECVCLFGGASKDTQRALLRRADIVVATPGRLKDFMADGTANLGAAAFVVLDEADRMLDKGFEEDIRQILGQTPPREERQTLMFTATWPESVRTLAATFMVRPVKITIGSSSRETTSGAVELQANARINQRVEILEGYAKEGRVLQIIKAQQQGNNKFDRILVFCLYKKEATRVESFLASKGVKVASIHGDLRQEQRTRSLEAFKSGQTPVLVATDVAARGLDIPEVKLVLNVTFPLTIEDYVHRIGRTGRAGKSGEAITLFTQQDKPHSGSLINILRSAKQPVPDELLKFGTTVKKKSHPIYGAFFKDQGPSSSSGPVKIKFDN